MRNRSISPTFVSVIFLLSSASQGIASTHIPDLLEGPTTKQQTSSAEFLYKDYVNGFSAGLGRLNVAPEVADEIEDSLKKRRTEPHPPKDIAASSCDETIPVWSIRPQMPCSELDVRKIDFLTAQAILWESTLVNSLSLQKSGWDAHQNVLRFSEAVQTSSKHATALENPKTKKLAEMMGSSVGDGTLMHLMVGPKERESHWLKHYDAEQKRQDAYRYRTYDPHYFAKSDWMFADRRFNQSYLKFFEEHPELDGSHARFEWVREVKFQIMALKQWRALTSYSYKNTTYLRRARFDAADVAALDCGLQFPLTKFSESSCHPDARMIWGLSKMQNTSCWYYVSGEGGSDKYGNIEVSVLRKGYSQNVRWKPTDPHANYGDQSEFYHRRDHFNISNGSANNPDPGGVRPPTKFKESSRHPYEGRVLKARKYGTSYREKDIDVSYSVLKKGRVENVSWEPTDPHANYGDQSVFYQRRDHFNVSSDVATMDPGTTQARNSYTANRDPLFAGVVWEQDIGSLYENPSYYQRHDHFNVSNGPANNPDPGAKVPAGAGGNYRRGYFDPIASKIDPRSIQLQAYYSAVGKFALLDHLRGHTSDDRFLLAIKERYPEMPARILGKKYLTFSRWREFSKPELGLAKPSHQVKQYRCGSHFNVASQQKADPGFKMPSGKVSSSKAPAKILVERHD